MSFTQRVGMATPASARLGRTPPSSRPLYEAEFHTLGIGPLHEYVCSEFWPIIESNHVRSVIDLNQLVYDSHDARHWNQGADLDTQRFQVAFVDDVQGAEGPTVVQAVTRNRAPISDSRPWGRLGVAAHEWATAAWFGVEGSASCHSPHGGSACGSKGDHRTAIAGNTKAPAGVTRD